MISDDEADWVQDPAVQLIIQSSNKDKDSGESTQSTVTIEEAIKQHRAKVLYPNSTNALCITVRRGSILDDTIFSLRPGFDEKKHIKVRFLG
ncbi:hypothetical protein GBAR_LOCUS3359 [Geodia barretti]|nr:hypothetical protein GBAR_LOCUS3359 [Geodia barretti]